MRLPPFALLTCTLLVAMPLAAQDKPAPQDKPDRPITDRDPNAVDVIATPATDLNLRKGEIPPILLAAQQDAYGLGGLRRCSDLAAEVRRLDAVLGEDIDIAQAASHKVRAGTVAQSVVGWI